MKKICPECGCAGGKHNRFCPTLLREKRSVTAVPDKLFPRGVVDTAELGSGYTLCACGCGEVVEERPAYFSPACRVRAKRQRDKDA